MSAVFSWKDLDVEWEKVERVSTLVEAALDTRREDAETLAKARRLEHFYPFLVKR